MWLPHYLFAFVSISQLVLDTNGSLEHTHLDISCPYDVAQGSFLKDFEKPSVKPGWWARGSRGNGSSGISRCKFFSSIQKSGKDAKVMQYFKTKFDSIDDDAKVVLAQKLFEYLLRNKSISQEALNAWVQELAGMLRQYQATSKVRSTIVYGLHTLLLKNFDQAELAQSIRITLDGIMKSLGPLEAALASLSEWDQELFKPASGLSEKFRTWSSLEPLLSHEPALSKLHQTLLHEPFPRAINSGIDNIRTIFLKQPQSEEPCSQSRIVAIALLFHLMYTNNEQVNVHAFQTIRLLRVNEHGHFILFNHETILLTKVMADLSSTYEDAPRPIGGIHVIGIDPPYVGPDERVYRPALTRDSLGAIQLQ
ncbi:hypothetical protein PGT21_025463 [Puccinia graminis f. sp. tritici]|uniref:Uncharacterized protein n=1 Tax=Puccinia graminis f. sp. tritici TaxID=56615 RepID=A0A5B0PLT4_PUCGR|nr:hypothetical protein PGT21_025463 [Puccinia graminis f. sp. tritici]